VTSAANIALILVGAFIVLALAIQLPLQDFALHVTCALIVLVAAFTFFSMGWVGGGDAKLAAATALWFGFGETLPYLVYAADYGGILTLALLMLRHWPLPLFLNKVGWIQRLHNHKSGVPYGIALAFAGLVTYYDTALYQQLLG
jgi:prepilin peptidase CpaA